MDQQSGIWAGANTQFNIKDLGHSEQYEISKKIIQGKKLCKIEGFKKAENDMMITECETNLSSMDLLLKNNEDQIFAQKSQNSKFTLKKQKLHDIVSPLNIFQQISGCKLFMFI